MHKASYKILKGVSLLVFVIAVITYLSSQIVSVASRRIPVRNEAGEVIGFASIPHDHGATQFMSLAVMILGGIQFWTIRNIGHALHNRLE